MIPGRNGRILFVIILASLALRLVLVLLLDAYVIERGWSFGYETGQIARALAEGDGFSSPFRQPSGPTAWLMPAYPAILALIFKLFGVDSTASALATLFFNSLCSALTCGAVFLVAKEPLGRTTALVAAAVMVVYPPSIWHSLNTIWDTSLLTLLVVGLVHGLYRLRETSRSATVALFGLALGGAAWVNPAVLSLLPLAWLRICRRSAAAPERRRLAQALLLTLVALLSLLPWLLRNYHQFGRFYLRSNLGLELKLGNSDAAWRDYLGGLHTAPWLLGHPSIDSNELQRFIELGEAAYVQHAFGEAATFIREHPSRFLRITLRRITFFWLSDLRARNDWAGNLDLALPLSWMRAASHLLPLPFSLLGIAVALRRRRHIEPLLGVLTLFPLVYYVTHVSQRYRYPIEPFLIILASYGAVWIVKRVLDRLLYSRHGG